MCLSEDSICEEWEEVALGAAFHQQETAFYIELKRYLDHN